MKEYASEFYKGKAWQKCRQAYIQSVHGLCEDCLARGRYVPGEIVHHIEHITPSNITNPEITLSFDNLRLVCRDCHAQEHKKQKHRRYTIDEFGNCCIFGDA